MSLASSFVIPIQSPWNHSSHLSQQLWNNNKRKILNGHSHAVGLDFLLINISCFVNRNFYLVSNSTWTWQNYLPSWKKLGWRFIGWPLNFTKMHITFYFPDLWPTLQIKYYFLNKYKSIFFTFNELDCSTNFSKNQCIPVTFQNNKNKQIV